MGQPYLDLARQGKNDWWRYLLSAGIILSFWLVLGSIPLLILLVMGLSQGEIAPTEPNIVENLDSLGLFTAILLGFIPLLFGLAIAVRLIHGRRLQTLITPEKRPNWKRLWFGFGLWSLIMILTSMIEAALYPGRYRLSFTLTEFIPFLIIGLILIPIQTSTEELLFRGYILQGLSLRLRSPVLLSTLNGLLFWLPHLGNPELNTDFWLVSASYVILGIFLTAITLRSQGLELALGVHAANNLFMSLVATYPNGALAASAIFTTSTLDPVYALISLLAGALIFYVVVFTGFPARFQQSEESR